MVFFTMLKKVAFILPIVFVFSCSTSTFSNNSDLDLHLLITPTPVAASNVDSKTNSTQADNNTKYKAPILNNTNEISNANSALVYNNMGPKITEEDVSNSVSVAAADDSSDNSTDDDEYGGNQEDASEDAQVVVDEKGVQSASKEEEVLAKVSEKNPEEVGITGTGEAIPHEGPIEKFFPLCDGSIYLKQWEEDFAHKWLKENPKKYKKAKDRNRAMESAKSQALAQLVFPMIKNIDSDYPTVINKDVINWIEYFQTAGRKAMVTWLKRGEDVIPVAVPILEKYGLPRDLVYLSMIESGFNNRAMSFASAVGAWQFIRSTGKIYSLRIDDFVDERRDPKKSTDAAARFLSDLYANLGDWYLAAASYNAGEGRIRKAKRKSINDDFFSLSNAKLLPNETRNYVPKLLAALYIGKNPAIFGFEIQQGSRAIATKTIKLTRIISIDDLAKQINVEVAVLSNLNPELRVNITPPITNKDTFYELIVPESHADKIIAALPNLPEPSLTRLVSGRVTRTETASRFSARLGVPLQGFLKVNPILKAKTRIIKGQSVWIPIKLGSGQYEKLTSAAFANKSKKKHTKYASKSKSKKKSRKIKTKT